MGENVMNSVNALMIAEKLNDIQSDNVDDVSDMEDEVNSDKDDDYTKEDDKITSKKSGKAASSSIQQLRQNKAIRICPQCKKGIPSAHFSRHINDVHEHFSFSCSKCNQSFKREECLKGHVCKMDETACPFHCDDCGLRFPNEAKLANHVKYKYRMCFRFYCEVCSERFSSETKY